MLTQDGIKKMTSGDSEVMYFMIKCYMCKYSTLVTMQGICLISVWGNNKQNKEHFLRETQQNVSHPNRFFFLLLMTII